MVNIPYMEHLGWNVSDICSFVSDLEGSQHVFFLGLFIGTSCGRSRGRSMVGHGTLPRDVGVSENGCCDLQLTIIFILAPLQY